SASTVGSVSAALSAKMGEASVLGKNVTIGQSSHLLNPGFTNKPMPSLGLVLLAGHQRATEKVVIDADNEVCITAGTSITRPVLGANTLRVNDRSVRAFTQMATLNLEKTGALHSGGSVLSVSPTAAVLAFVPLAPKLAYDASVKAAE